MKTLIEMGINKNNNFPLPFSNETIKKRSQSLAIKEEIEHTTESDAL